MPSRAAPADVGAHRSPAHLAFGLTCAVAVLHVLAPPTARTLLFGVGTAGLVVVGVTAIRRADLDFASGWRPLARWLVVYGGTMSAIALLSLAGVSAGIRNGLYLVALLLSVRWLVTAMRRLLPASFGPREIGPWLDGAAAGAAAAYTVHQLVVQPGIAAGQPAVPLLGGVVYLAVCAMLLVVLVRRITLLRQRNASVLYLLAAVLLGLVSPMTTPATQGVSGLPATIGGTAALLAFAALAAAALHPSMRELGGDHAVVKDLSQPFVVQFGVVTVACALAVTTQITVATRSAAPVDVAGFLLQVLLLVALLGRVAASLSGRRTAELEARALADHYQALVQDAADGIGILDGAGAWTFMSPSCLRVTGLPPETYVGERLAAQVHPDDAALVTTMLERALSRPDGRTSGEFRMLTADGNERWIGASIRNQVDNDAVGGLVVNFRDISERRASEQAIERLALYDHLTELPNRVLLLRHLRNEIARVQTTGQTLSVMFCDLDHFKVVNDFLGHRGGDQLLMEAAQRLQAAAGPEALVARLGGDEFVVALAHAADDGAAEAHRIADRLRRVLGQPFTLEGRDLRTTGSIGVATLGPSTATPEELLRDADAAMYAAKSRGRDCVAVFDESLRAAVEERLLLEVDLRHAIERDELELAYQPVVQMPDEEVVAVEALVRWRHPTLGLVPPGSFISLAEVTGLIEPLGEWVLRRACEDLPVLSAAAGRDLAVAVNASAVQVRRPGFVDLVADVLADTGTAPERLYLELTESVLIDEDAGPLQVIASLRHLGVRIVVDDFGTGYSALSYLRRLTIDELKIDRSFINTITSDAADVAIVEAILSMARALGLSVVAEGVETEAQRAALEALGCTRMQGYLFARPQSRADLAAHFAAAEAVEAKARTA